MKQLLLVSLIVLSNFAQANVGAKDIRLSYERTPLKALFHNVNLQRVKITVDKFGVATGYIATTPGHYKQIALKVFLKNEMAQINHLIEEASEGEMELPNPHAIHCMAVPVSQVSYTADNGKVMLYSAAVPCGRHTRNISSAADELVDMLNELVQTMNSELDAESLRS